MSFPVSVPQHWFARTSEELALIDDRAIRDEQTVIDLYAAADLLRNKSAAATAFDQSFNAAQTGAMAGAPASAAAPTLAQDINVFVGSIVDPYQALVGNTVTNLAAINSTFAADPFPLLRWWAGSVPAGLPCQRAGQYRTCHPGR